MSSWPSKAFLSPATRQEAFTLTVEMSEGMQNSTPRPGAIPAQAPLWAPSRTLTAKAAFSEVGPWAFQELKRLVASHFMSTYTSMLSLLQLHKETQNNARAPTVQLSSVLRDSPPMRPPGSRSHPTPSAEPPPPPCHHCEDISDQMGKRVVVSSS